MLTISKTCCNIEKLEKTLKNTKKYQTQEKKSNTKKYQTQEKKSNTQKISKI